MKRHNYQLLGQHVLQTLERGPATFRELLERSPRWFGLPRPTFEARRNALLRVCHRLRGQGVAVSERHPLDRRVVVWRRP